MLITELPDAIDSPSSTGHTESILPYARGGCDCTCIISDPFLYAMLLMLKSCWILLESDLYDILICFCLILRRVLCAIFTI